jgi:hypothetical protein
MPRAAFGLFAIAMTAFTIGLTVFVPANMDVRSPHDGLVSTSPAQHAIGMPHVDQEG